MSNETEPTDRTTAVAEMLEARNILAAAIDKVDGKHSTSLVDVAKRAAVLIEYPDAAMVPTVAQAKRHLLRLLLTSNTSYPPTGSGWVAEAYEALVRAELLEREGRPAGIVRDLETGAPTDVAIRVPAVRQPEGVPIESASWPYKRPPLTKEEERDLRKGLGHVGFQDEPQPLARDRTPLEVDPDSNFARAARGESKPPPEAVCRNCGCLPGGRMRGVPVAESCIICGVTGDIEPTRGSGPEAA